ncbi:MAG: APHP domain-containing protein, partial [Planctomycetes bacterium]|nr:APHP domain-containing protein [Planctomycetota bacterium]
MWSDRVYFSSNGQIAGAVLLASVNRGTDLAAGDSYTVTIDVPLPGRPDGDYDIIVVSDSADRVFEGPLEDNNTTLASERLTLTHADLVPTILAAPADGVAGGAITVTWTETNQGSGTAAAWFDRFYLSTDGTVSGDDRLIAEFAFTDPLAGSDTVQRTEEIALPVDVDGTLFLLLRADAANDLGELSAGEANNVAASLMVISLTPYTDLAVSDVVAPTQTIGDPAEVTVSWTVTNEGTGVGFTTAWTDVVIASKNAIAGDSDDIVLAEFVHDGALGAGETYSRSETFLLPPAFTGRFNLFVKSDYHDEVFEAGYEANNAAASPDVFDVMPVPYADLVVTAIDVPIEGFAGQPIQATWNVQNQGIGLTNRGDWFDRVYLARNADGSDPLDETFVRYRHFGQISPGDSYDRTGTIDVPDGLEGTFYLVVETAEKDAPFEFIYTNNNSAVSASIPVTLLPSPDLIVTSIVAPLAAQEGSLVDFSWTVANQGLGDADGSWIDRVYLQEAGDPNADIIQLGTFTFNGPLPAGQSYTRAEAIQVPVQTNELYRVFVTTDYEEHVFESDEANNTTFRTETLSLSAKPRPDLQVQNITIPDSVPAGASLTVDFTIINQGPEPTMVPNWVDRVYLSLDTTIDKNDVLIGESGNQAALAHGEQYTTTTDPVVVPLRFRGDVYIIVSTDHTNKIEEWPNENNNVVYKSI